MTYKTPIAKFFPLILIFTSFVFLISLFSVSANETQEDVHLYFSGRSENLSVGERFTVKVLISAPRAVNVFDAAIEYSSGTLELYAFETKNSIIQLWKDGPAIPEGNVFLVTGGNISGWSGKGGELITLHFRVKALGPAYTKFKKGNVYYSDGLGTKSKVISEQFNYLIKSGAGSSSPGGEKGFDRNEILAPKIAALDVIENKSEGSRLVVWAFDNEISSLKKTEARFFSLFSWSEWIPAASPMKIPDNAWGVEVRATSLTGDVSGKIAYTIPPIINTAAIYALVLAGLALIIKFALRFFRRS